MLSALLLELLCTETNQTLWCSGYKYGQSYWQAGNRRYNPQRTLRLGRYPPFTVVYNVNLTPHYKCKMGISFKKLDTIRL